MLNTSIIDEISENAHLKPANRDWYIGKYNTNINYILIGN